MLIYKILPYLTFRSINSSVIMYILLLLFSIDLRAAETGLPESNDYTLGQQRWRADLSAIERAKDLPWFPFNTVLEEGGNIQGLNRRQSIIKAAKYLLRYAHTASNPEKKAGFILGYFKIAAEYPDVLLNRRAYAERVNPLLDLYRDIETMYNQVLGMEVEKKFKSHAAIWLARLLMKIAPRQENAESTQLYLQQAKNLLQIAYKQRATDSVLLWIAELYLRYHLRLDNDMVISDEQAVQLAGEALDCIGRRSSQGQGLRSQLERLKQSLQSSNDSQIEISEDFDCLDNKNPYMSRREQKNLYGELLEEFLSQRRQIHMADAMEIDMDIEQTGTNTAIDISENEGSSPTTAFRSNPDFPRLSDTDDLEAGSELEEELPTYMIIPKKGPYTLFSHAGYELKQVQDYPGLDHIVQAFDREIRMQELGEPLNIYTDFPVLLAHCLGWRGLKLVLFTGENRDSFNSVYFFPPISKEAPEFRMHCFKRFQSQRVWYVVCIQHGEDFEEAQKNTSLKKRSYKTAKESDLQPSEEDRPAKNKYYRLSAQERAEFKQRLEEYIQKHPIRSDLSIKQFSAFVSEEIERQKAKQSRAAVERRAKKFLQEHGYPDLAEIKRGKVDQSIKEKINNDFLSFKEGQESQSKPESLFSEFYKKYRHTYPVSRSTMLLAVKKSGQFQVTKYKSSPSNPQLRKEINKAINKWLETKVGSLKPTTSQLREWLQKTYPQLSPQEIWRFALTAIKKGTVEVPPEQQRSTKLTMATKLDLIRNYVAFMSEILEGKAELSPSQYELRKKKIEQLSQTYNCKTSTILNWIYRLGLLNRKEPDTQRRELLLHLIKAKNTLLVRDGNQDIPREKLVQKLNSFPYLTEFCNTCNINTQKNFLNAAELYSICIEHGIMK